MSTVAVHQLKILYPLRGYHFYYGAEVSFISMVTVLTQAQVNQQTKQGQLLQIQ